MTVWLVCWSALACVWPGPTVPGSSFTSGGSLAYDSIYSFPLLLQTTTFLLLPSNMTPPPVTAASSPDPPAVEVANPGKSEQFWLESSHGDKAKFWAKRWYPTNPESGEEVKPKSTVIFCHGFVEYVDRYRNILQVFSAGGHEVVGFDQRGWGQTVLATGNAKRNYGNTTWPQQMEDLEFVIRETKKRTDEKWGAGQVPIFIMGHSMGGGIVLAFMTRPDEWRTKNRVQAPSQEAKDMVKGVISLSPWLRLTDVCCVDLSLFVLADANLLPLLIAATPLAPCLGRQQHPFKDSWHAMEGRPQG